METPCALAGTATRAAIAARNVRKCFIAITCLLDPTLFQEFAQQTMEMVHAPLAGGRIPSLLVEPRAHAPLDRLDDRLVLGLDAIQPRPRPGLELRLVPDERPEDDPRAVNRLRLDEVERQAPRIEVEHQVREH